MLETRSDDKYISDLNYYSIRHEIVGRHLFRRGDITGRRGGEN